MYEELKKEYKETQRKVFEATAQKKKWAKCLADNRIHLAELRRKIRIFLKNIKSSFHQE